MSGAAILGDSATSANQPPTEEHFPWDIEPAPSVVESDTWLLSFIDILTLLLALFVLLLAQEHQRNTSLDAQPPARTPDYSNIAPEAPIQAPRPFSAIHLPPLPQIVSPLDRMLIPAIKRNIRHPKTVMSEAPATKPARPPVAEKIIHAAAPAGPPAPEPVDTFLATLRRSGLAERLDIQTLTDSVRLDIADSILFAPASTTLTKTGLALLGELASSLNALPWSLSVEGHTDNVPIRTARFPSNWELSTARATQVARELIRHGIRPDHIRAIGYADTRPRDTNDTATGRNRNRRVTFVLEIPASSNRPQAQ